MKRSLILRCLVVLLSIALASGNAHAALHLDAAHSEPCPEEHAHHHGETAPRHQHQHDKKMACCCDCLGCTSAAYLAGQGNWDTGPLTKGESKEIKFTEPGSYYYICTPHPWMYGQVIVE